MGGFMGGNGAGQWAARKVCEVVEVVVVVNVCWGGGGEAIRSWWMSKL